MKKLFSKTPILLVAILLVALGTALIPNVVSADPPWVSPTFKSSPHH
ncbi:hypothetical protein PAJ34TS1_58900 [Paenibacillus azoreducens]